MSETFFSPFSHGFARVAAAVPRQYPGEPARNAEATSALARRAAESGAQVVVFPELGLSGYSLDDLFQQEAILEATECALEDVLRESLTIEAVLCVGFPARAGDRLYNCAGAVYRGRLLAVTPKMFIPQYREFYEKRHFVSGASAGTPGHIRIAGQNAPFGSNILIDLPRCAGMRVHMEICEDVWTPSPPSTEAALAGATCLVNLSASNITIGKAEYRHQLASSQSARCLAAYVYCGAGEGESTNDLAWDSHALIYENGRLLGETARFSADEQLVFADIDIEMLRAERMRMTSFADSVDYAVARRHPASSGMPAASERPETSAVYGTADTARFETSTYSEASSNSLETGSGNSRGFRLIKVDDLRPDTDITRLERPVPRFPYVPADHEKRNERCFEAYNIQVQALAQRLRATGIDKIIIGISGGLDSTHALIVACRAMDRLGLPRTNVIARTMPGFATSGRTRTNAHALMSALGVDAGEIDIRESCMQMFRDIGHPYANGEEVYDVTFENVQAGERTSHLFRLANLRGGLVLGTGDLSELALGWATYGVGDHMSHYAVNASVPKTLIRYLIRWVADTGEAGEKAADILRDIVATEISPELIPGKTGSAGSGEAAGDKEHSPAQRSEDTIGPYELQDFHLYYTSRYGFRPSKIAFLSMEAWGDRERGAWPEDIPESERNDYTRGEITHWLRVFLKRFFAFSQFKRTCIPNGPKVGSGGSLSPRGDWRAPSDISARTWIEELEANVPEA